MPEYDVKAVWPGWETVRLIGRGSYGAVYEIERNVFEEQEKAALKVITIPQSSSEIDELYSEGFDDQSITNTFKTYLKSIVAEYSLMRKMNGSANVVNCDDVRYVQHDDGFGWDIFIKMELLAPLTKVLGKDVSDEQVVQIGSDICKALMLCEKHNIIHRDIKPANIFVSENGDYKLGDFGIAKTVEKTSGGTKIGTYDYMAPEVYHDQPYGSTADIYSLGMVLYWLLNEHRAPFLKLPPVLPSNSEKEQVRKRRFSGEKILAPAHGSEELKQIVLKACSFDPKDRYQSAEEMLKELERLNRNSAPKPCKLEYPAEKETAEESGSLWTISNEETLRDEATIGSFDNKTIALPPKKPASSTKSKKRLALFFGTITALTIVFSGLFYLPGWAPATCETAEKHNLLGITRGEALGHDWGEWAIIKDASCSETGYEERICANDASHVERRIIPMASHTWLAATCDEPAVCAVCGLESGNPIGHDWGEPYYEWSTDNSTVTATRVCKYDHNHVEQETERTTSEVTTQATCESQGTTTYTVRFKNKAFLEQIKTVINIDALGHEWIEATNEAPKTCIRCGITEGKKLEKSPSAADLEALGSTIVFPDKESYLLSYEYKYVKSGKGNSIYLFLSPSQKSETKIDYVPEATEVCVIAREGYSSCVIYTTQQGKLRAGWVSSKYLYDWY